jgi:hypothetical protein
MYLGRTGLAAYDLSGDIGVINDISSIPPTIDVSGLDALTDENLLGRVKGSLGYSAFFNPAVGGHHTVMQAFRTAAALAGTVALYEHRNIVGQPAAFGKFLQLGYRTTRAPNGALTVPISLADDGAGPCWGPILWTGVDASAAVHAASDFGVTSATGTISAVSVANPTHLTSTAHGLTSGQKILIAGNSSTPSLNGTQTVTVLDADHFTVPVNVTVAGTGGTFQRTSSSYGFRAAAMVVGLTSGSMAPLWEDSDDGTTGWATLAGSTMAAMTLADGVRFVQVISNALVRRFVRVSSTGTFSNADFRAAFCRRMSAWD